MSCIFTLCFDSSSVADHQFIQLLDPLKVDNSQTGTALYQERAVSGKMKMDPAKRAQTQNAGEVSWLQRFFSQSIELMMDKVWLHCIRPMLLK